MTRVRRPSSRLSRRRFLELCGLLGLAAPLAACAALGSDDVGAGEELAGTFDGRVLVIGAGAAGLSAAHLLHRQGVDVTVLEAASTHGGRIKRSTTFVDFPIPLGGEWLHGPPALLDELVADPDVEITTPLVGYGPDDQTGHYDGELVLETSESSDLKFVGATWLDVFDAYLVPGIADRLRFDTPIVEIDHRGDTIVVTDAGGGIHEADRVIVTVPLRVLQDEELVFTPDLDDDKWEALDEAWAWGGFKAFIEFDERFYPSSLTFPDSDTGDGQRLYYDAAHGQDSDSHVLGLFSVGTGAEPYQALRGDALRDHLLAELDEVFDGAASRSYRRHISQDWSAEPFIGQAYLYDGSPSWIPRALWEPIDDRLYFAGEAYTRHGDWGAVHDAARAARDVVARILV